jgi:hypothetical protein
VGLLLELFQLKLDDLGEWADFGMTLRWSTSMLMKLGLLPRMKSTIQTVEGRIGALDEEGHYIFGELLKGADERN